MRNPFKMSDDEFTIFFRVGFIVSSTLLSWIAIYGIYLMFKEILS